MYRLVVALLFALVIAVFAHQNAMMVDAKFLFWPLPTLSLALVILGSSAAGAILVGILGAFRHFRFSRRIREHQAEIKKLEADIKERANREASLKEKIDVLERALEPKEEEQPPEPQP